MTHTFYPVDGRMPIDVAPELWRWEAHYIDGSVFKQFDDVGVYHQFKEIEQDKLASFRMVSDCYSPIIVLWKPGLKLIQFMYRVGVMRLGAEDEARYRLPCFGYQDKAGPHILVVMPDGALVLTDDVEKVTVVM